MVDRLDVGPCRFEGIQEPSEWLHNRLAWWQEHDHHDRQPYIGSAFDEVRSLDDVITNIDKAVLWVAEGALEHLHACWLADLLPDSIELAHGQPENRWENNPTLFIGLVPSEVFVDAPLRAISASERETQQQLWRAFIEPTPIRFFELAAQHSNGCVTSGLPALVSHFPTSEVPGTPPVGHPANLRWHQSSGSRDLPTGSPPSRAAFVGGRGSL